MSAVSLTSDIRILAVSRESYSQTPDSVVTRPRTHSHVTPARRRKISQGTRRVSQTALTRKRRESRHAMQSAASNVSRDQHLDVVKEMRTNQEHQGYFDKVGFQARCFQARRYFQARGFQARGFQGGCFQDRLFSLFSLGVFKLGVFKLKLFYFLFGFRIFLNLNYSDEPAK